MNNIRGATEYRTGVVFPLQPGRMKQIVPFAELLRDRGTGRLWLGQSLRLETHQVLAYLAGAGIRVPVGSSVTLMPLRHPYDAAVQARSLAAISGFPYTAGIGPGAPEFQECLLPNPYPSPLSAVHDYLTTMRRLLDGEKDPHTLRLPPMDAPPVELGLGVLRPRMATLAGSIADVAITWLTPAEYIRDHLLPNLATGAEHAGRPSPRVATVVHVAVARPGRDIVRCALAGAGVHLGLDHYTNMLRRAGVPADPADPHAGAAALVDAGVFVTGTPDRIAAELLHLRDCGVNEIILNPAGVFFTEGTEAAIADLQEILAVDDVQVPVADGSAAKQHRNLAGGDHTDRPGHLGLDLSQAAQRRPK